MGKKVKKVANTALNAATLGVWGAIKGSGGSADNAYAEQEKALQAQIDAMKESANAATTVQTSIDPAAIQQNTAQNAQINAANEEAARRRRATLAGTYNTNSRLYGALTGGKNILGG